MNDSERKKMKQARLRLSYADKEYQCLLESNCSKRLVYPEQVRAAEAVFHEFVNNHRSVVLLMAMMQAGKTMCMIHAAYLLCMNDSDEALDYEKVFFVTGMSDKEWMEQMVEDLPQVFKSNVYHRDLLKNLVPTVMNITDALFVIDETHIASEERQTIDNFFTTIGLGSENGLEQRRVRILMVSATPNSPGVYTQICKSKGATVKLNPGDNYCGFKEMMQEGRIRPSFTLSNLDHLRALFIETETRWPTRPLYHIVRRPSGRGSKNVLEGLLRMCREHNWDLMEHNAESRIEQVKNFFDIAPSRHTIIFIKGFWRAAKRLDDKNIGFLHENTANIPDDAVTAQGLAGRCCGHGKKRGPDGVILYHNIRSIERYIAWWDNDGDYTSSDWNSRTIRSTADKGITKIRKSFNSSFSSATPKVAPKNEVAKQEASLEWMIAQWSLNLYQPKLDQKLYELIKANDRLRLMGQQDAISTPERPLFVVTPIDPKNEKERIEYYIRQRLNRIRKKHESQVSPDQGRAK